MPRLIGRSVSKLNCSQLQYIRSSDILISCGFSLRGKATLQHEMMKNINTSSLRYSDRNKKYFRVAPQINWINCFHAKSMEVSLQFFNSGSAHLSILQSYWRGITFQTRK